MARSLNTPIPTNWMGAVLAGGRSRRMGRDKASLPWGSTTLLGHAVARLHTLVDDVYVLGRADAYGAKGLPDPSPHAGPLAALAGLANRVRCPLLVLAVDMPLVRPQLAATLCAHAVDRCADAAVPVADGHLQPLCAAYTPVALADMAAAVEAGLRAPIRWLQQTKVSVLRIGPDDCGLSRRAWDTELQSLNTPEEYTAWRPTSN